MYQLNSNQESPECARTQQESFSPEKPGRKLPLSESQREELLSRYDNGERPKKIAESMGIDKKHVYSCVASRKQRDGRKTVVETKQSGPDIVIENTSGPDAIDALKREKRNIEAREFKLRRQREAIDASLALLEKEF